MPLLVSSDIIESLFGKFKHIIERSPVAEINRMALVIPTLCGGRVDSEQVELAFTQVKHREISEWEEANIATTLRKQRRIFMQDIQNTGYQKPGNIGAL